ncbi:MAG TPA: hypothetical protein PKK23_15785 [Nitrospirales bacterium]|nr:hypothetical protein [Nitrospirales bacterium]
MLLQQQQINEPESRCRYCGHVLFLGQTEEGMVPVCPHCAAVEHSLDGVSLEA